MRKKCILCRILEKHSHNPTMSLASWQFTCDESNVDEVVGYVTYVVSGTTEDGER